MKRHMNAIENDKIFPQWNKDLRSVDMSVYSVNNGKLHRITTTRMYNPSGTTQDYERTEVICNAT